MDISNFLGALAGNFEYWIDFFIAWLIGNLAMLLGL